MSSINGNDIKTQACQNLEAQFKKITNYQKQIVFEQNENLQLGYEFLYQAKQAKIQNKTR